MTEPTENERRQINERLARAMEWDFIPYPSEAVNALEPDRGEWYTPKGKLYGDEPPDFTLSTAASRELVVWLTSPLNSEARSREDVKRWGCFTDTLWRELDLDGDDYPWLITEKLLTAPPLLIAMAADEAIGGKDEC